MDYATINKDDAFRNAFNSIARHALPFMAEDSYHSDLLYDAARATALDVDARFYLLVRALGTNTFAYGDDAIKHCDPALSDGRAVLRVIRKKFNVFQVDVVFSLGTDPK